MATFLYRLGRLSFRRRRIVVMLWVAVLAAIGIGAMSAPGTSAGALSVPGTQSQKAIDLLQKEFPQASADGATARVVFEAPIGQKLTSAANKAEVESLVAKLEKSPQVSGVSDPDVRLVHPAHTTMCLSGAPGGLPPPRKASEASCRNVSRLIPCTTTLDTTPKRPSLKRFEFRSL